MKNESWFPLGIPWKQERFLLWTGLLLLSLIHISEPTRH